jgi:hypothetical protein
MGLRSARFAPSSSPGFLIEVEFFAPEELEQEPVYRDLSRPQGVGWGMATAITLPTGDNAMFVLSRPTELGPAASRLDALRPHLASAKANGVQLGQFITLLQELGTGDV